MVVLVVVFLKQLLLRQVVQVVVVNHQFMLGPHQMEILLLVLLV